MRIINGWGCIAHLGDVYSALKMNSLAALVLFSLVFGACNSTNVKNATLITLPHAVVDGAVCLDGSPPGYYWRAAPKGGRAQNMWILHLGGGGWCNSTINCYNRSKTWLGTSKSWVASVELNGFLSDVKAVNPHFYDWNIVYLMYCDGMSFASDSENPDVYNNTKIYYRGLKVLDALLKDLLKKGMSYASDVILTGCSAGGLATYLHADAVHSYLPKSVKYRAFADAGYFLDIPTMNGVYEYRNDVENVYKKVDVTKGLNQECLKAKPTGWPCWFAPYSYRFIKIPIFVLNSIYDTAQLAGIYKLPCFPPNCTEGQMQQLMNFGSFFREQAAPVLESNSTMNGYFLDSCLVHCQTLYDDTWTTYTINKQSIESTFSSWYYGNKDPKVNTKIKDCPYPCNSSCPKKHNPLEVKSADDHTTEFLEKKFAP